MFALCKAGSGRSTAYSKCVSGYILCLLLPLWQCAHAIEKPSAGESQPPTYVDQLIDPAIDAESLDPVYREYMEQPAGRRYLSAGLVHFREDRDGQGVSHETGLNLLYRRETHDYGELETEAALLNVSSAQTRNNDPSTGALLTFRQRDFALNNQWMMQNSLGVDRTVADPVLTGSYRFKLPSSLQTGFSTHLSSADSDIRFGIGKLGKLDTGQVQTFDTSEGRLLSFGYSKDIDSRHHAAVHIVSVNNAANVPDHESIAGVIQYDDPVHERRLQAHILGDSEGAGGLWLDADIKDDVWRKRFGLFRLDPGLLWSEATMSSDQQGFYTRMERRSLRNHITVGVDLNRTDIDDNPLVNGLRTTSAFLTGGRFLDLRTSFGGTFAFRDIISTDSIVSDDTREIELTVFGSRRMPFGTSRVQLQFADLRESSAHGHRNGIIWDQSWSRYRDMEISSTLGFEAERGTGNDEDRTTAGVLFNHDLKPGLRWDANINWTHISRSASGANGNSVNASLALLWRFLPGWEAVLQGRVNEASQSGSIGLGTSDFTEREKTLLLSIRHQKASGRAFERYGAGTGKKGYGTVEGVVFFDENRDGIRQANERLASGVYVYLDRRYQKASDRDGRFEFSSVLAGDHTVSIMLEDIPLPWILDDESPRRVTVNVRGRSTVLFPLVRFDE